MSRVAYSGQSPVCQWGSRLLADVSKDLFAFIFKVKQKLKRLLDLWNCSKCNTIQYNTIQYNTIQYNTIQYFAKSDAGHPKSRRHISEESNRKQHRWQNLKRRRDRQPKRNHSDSEKNNNGL